MFLAVRSHSPRPSGPDPFHRPRRPTGRSCLGVESRGSQTKRDQRRPLILNSTEHGARQPIRLPARVPVLSACPECHPGSLQMVEQSLRPVRRQIPSMLSNLPAVAFRQPAGQPPDEEDQCEAR